MAHSRPQSVADKICDSRGGAVTPSLNSRRGLFGSPHHEDNTPANVMRTVESPERPAIGENVSNTKNHEEKNLRTSRGKLRMLRELQDHNSPPARSESPESFSPSKEDEPARVTNTHKRNRKNIEKELASFNDETHPETMLDLLADPCIRNTRRTARVLGKLLNNEELPKEKSLNERKLASVAPNSTKSVSEEDDNAENQSEDNSQFTEYHSLSSVDTDVDAVIDDVSEDGMKASSEPIPTLRRRVRHLSCPQVKPISAITRPEFDDHLDWDKWQSHKDQAIALLETARYAKAISSKPRVSRHDQQPAYQPLVDIPEGYNFHMDSGTFTFTPTLEVFGNFAAFLAVVEEIAGRAMGCVKVIVPQGYLAPIGPGVPPQGSVMLSTKLIQGTKKPLQSSKLIAYHIKSSPLPSQPANTSAIEQHRREVTDAWALNADRWADAWRDISFEDTFKEARMIEHICSDEPSMIPKASAHEPVYWNMRFALELKDSKLAHLTGNRLHESTVQVIGFQLPQLEVAHSSGVPIALHCKDSATYSICYLHKGAPRTWTIIKPKEHAKLEERLHFFTGDEHIPTDEGVRVRYPPQCDQFIRHQSLYLPKETLDSFKLGYSIVAQHQNEMLITFPYAYRQAYNTGPNIVEEMAYASHRWDVFHRKHLYHPCGSKCPEKPPNLDLGFVHAPRERITGYVHEPAREPDMSTKQAFDHESSLSSDENSDSNDSDWSTSATEPKLRRAFGRSANRSTSLKPLPDLHGRRIPMTAIVPKALPSSKLLKDMKRGRDDKVVDQVNDMFSSTSKRQRKD